MASLHDNNKVVSIGSQIDFLHRLELLEGSNKSFILEISNYTQTLKYNTNGQDKIFTYMLGMRSTKTFAAYNKIKKDLKALKGEKRDLLNKIMSENNMQGNKYYSVKYALIPQHIKSAVCIDINSAYATILFNTGLITRQTYDFICKIDKPSRLASVGMLASRKSIFYYEGGEIDEVEEVESEYRNLFGFLVNETFRIMEAAKSFNRSNWIFTWVDGIYFKNSLSFNPESLVSKIRQHYNLNCKIEQIRDFKIERKKENILMDFEKQNRAGNWKKKVYNFPDPNIIQNISKLILNQK